MRRFTIVSIAVLFFFSLVGSCFAKKHPAQEPVVQNFPAPDPAKVQAFIAREFGSGYKLISSQPPLVLDFDGDGTEDLVAVTSGPNPFEEQGKYNYKVADPYDEYFGYGNPRVTIQFGGLDPDRRRFLLIAQDWLHTPKSKVILINVPEFQTLKVGTFMVKKKIVRAITGAEGDGGVDWAIYWDGKKYRWEAFGMSSENN